MRHAGAKPGTLEFALVRHLPCPTGALSSYSPGDGRCWDRARRTHVYSPADEGHERSRELQGV